MMADFTMYKGDTRVLEVTVQDADENPVDITGVAIKWQAAKKVKSTDILISKTTGSGISIIDGPAGRFNVTIDPADTEELKAGRYYHEAELNDGGVVSTVLIGYMTLTETLIPSV